jgi:hypothetical protein
MLYQIRQIRLAKFLESFVSLFSARNDCSRVKERPLDKAGEDKERLGK